MKPKTKLQFQVLELRDNLSEIRVKMLEWAKVSCLEHKGFATKNRVICMDCGQKFSTENIKRKRAICPHCGTKLTIENSRYSTDKQHLYVAYADVFNDFQLVRCFKIKSDYKAGRDAYYSSCEILQHWILPNKKREVISLNHSLNYYMDSWNGEMEIRGKSNLQRYDIYHCKIHPNSKFKPEYKKYGIDHHLKGLTVLEAITHIPENPKLETLLKAKQYNLLAKGIEYIERISRYWPSIKICIRKNYIVKETTTWFDYLDLLSYFNKDLHNAHFVCPRNLKLSHDKLVEKKLAIQRKQDLELKKIRAAENEEKFQKLKAKFFGIQFSDDVILVKVLNSVQEYVLEGDKLHHCVFTNEYFSKPDSLILSARINNEPIETVEVSLKNFMVLQSRGLRNQNTEHHDRIIELVNKNIKLIKQRKNETKRKPQAKSIAAGA